MSLSGCAFIIRVDSKASLTAAVIMLGSIKRSECIVSNDNDHVYLPIDSIVFRLCKDRGVCKHKINSQIDEKLRDPAHKIMGATSSSSRQKG